MQILLSTQEIKIITAYRKHLWDVGKRSFTFRATLERIILENGAELAMIKRELFSEEKNIN